MATTMCQYHCAYCSARKDHELESVKMIQPERWVEAFRRTGVRWHLHVTGGEPLLHPWALKLFPLLSEEHELSLNTNLPPQPARKIGRLIVPRNLRYIHVGVHPEERAAHGGPGELRDTIDVLTSIGHRVFPSCVMSPLSFKWLTQEIQRYREDYGIVLIPKAFRGIVQVGDRRIQYPAGYTDSQCEQFRALVEISYSHYREWIEGVVPTVNPFLDQLFVGIGFPGFTGKICRAGVDFVRISPTGEVQRCDRHAPLGNILDGTFARAERPAPCNDSGCPYFCFRYLVTTHVC